MLRIIPHIRLFILMLIEVFLIFPTINVAEYILMLSQPDIGDYMSNLRL